MNHFLTLNLYLLKFVLPWIYWQQLCLSQMHYKSKHVFLYMRKLIFPNLKLCIQNWFCFQFFSPIKSSWRCSQFLDILWQIIITSHLIHLCHIISNLHKIITRLQEAATQWTLVEVIISTSSATVIDDYSLLTCPLLTQI